MAPRKKPSSDEIQRQGFLAAILAAPLDDVPRLVFSDWLEEHGDTDRAEFIRLGCRLEQMDEDDPQRAETELRTNELLYRHIQTWKQEAPPWTRKRIEFRRGFVDSITTSAAHWIKRADKVLATVPITRVHLIEVREHLAELLAAPVLARLDHLGTWDRLEDTGVVALASVPALAGLRSLDLHGVYLGDTGMTSLATSPYLAGLLFLNVFGNDIGGVGAEALARTTTLVRLTDLDLGRNKIDDRGLRALARSPVLASVRKLGLFANSFGDMGAAALGASPHTGEIRTLGLAGNDIGNAGAEALAASAHLGNLRKLYLHGNNIGDRGALALAASPALAGIRDLSLNGDRLGERATQALRERFGERVRL
jgi:uncharacterized protein (TIGR02996 family)